MTEPTTAAPPQVSITMSDDEQLVLLDALASHLDWLAETKRDLAPAMRLYQRIGELTAARPSAPSDGLDALLAECEAISDDLAWTMSRERVPFATNAGHRWEWRYRVLVFNDSLMEKGEAETPAEALKSALAAAGAGAKPE